MDDLKARIMIERASDDLERNEFPAARGPYFSLRNFADRSSTARKVQLAAAAFLYGSRQLRGSRLMDDLFECSAADEVAAALAERADREPALYAAIASDFSGVFPDQWRARAGALL